MSETRSLVWLANGDPATSAEQPTVVVKDGETLQFIIQRFDLVDTELVIRLARVDSGEDTTLATIKGSLRGVHLTRTFPALFLEPSAIERAPSPPKPQQCFLIAEDEDQTPDDPVYDRGTLTPTQADKLAKRGDGVGDGFVWRAWKSAQPLAKFNVLFPRYAQEVALLEDLEIWGPFGTGQFQVAVEVWSADGAVKLSPGPDEPHVVAHVQRDLADPRVLDRWTPITAQAATQPLPAVVIAKDPSDADADKKAKHQAGTLGNAGCGSVCLTKIFRYWDELGQLGAVDRDAEVVQRGGLAESPEALPLKKKKGKRFTPEEVEALDRDDVRATLTFVWWYRKHFLFPHGKKSQASIDASPCPVHRLLLHFPDPPGSAARFETMFSFKHNGHRRDKERIFEFTLQCLTHRPPIPVMFRQPGHWMVVVGYAPRNQDGDPCLILHDSGGVVGSGDTKAGKPPGYSGRKKLLYYMRVKDFLRKATHLFAIAPLQPRAGLPSYP